MEESIVTSKSVCVQGPAGLSVRKNISRTTNPIFINYNPIFTNFVHATYDHGSILLWWRFDT